MVIWATTIPTVRTVAHSANDNPKSIFMEAAIIPQCQDRCRLSLRDFVLILWGTRKRDYDPLFRRIQSEHHCQTAAPEQCHHFRGFERNRYSQGYTLYLAA